MLFSEEFSTTGKTGRTRYRAVFKDIENDNGQWVGELERQSKGGNGDTKNRRLEDQDMMTYSLGGEHLLGRWKLDWSGSYSKASEDRPNERYFEIATDGTVDLNTDFSNPEFPFVEAAAGEFQNPSSSWELSEITEEFQYTEDIDLNSRVNLSIPLNRQNNSFLKVGTRTRSKTKSRNNDFYEYSPVDEDALLADGFNNLVDETKDNFLPGDEYNIGKFISPGYLSSLDLNGAEFEEERDLSELAGNFEATENIFGGYAMVDHQFNSKFKVIAGLRLEQTMLEYEGFAYDDEMETLEATPKVSNDYLNILPSVHLKYNLNPTTVLRMAYTNTLARPNYFDLVPYREIEDGEALSIGNPDLNPTTSMNFDFMAEKYFGNVGVLSGGLFYKDIQDFIVAQSFDDYEFEGTVWDNFSQPINGGNASLFGAEVAFQRQLGLYLSGLKRTRYLYQLYLYTINRDGF